MTFLPPDVAAANSLFAVIADPVASQARLKELSEAATALKVQKDEVEEKLIQYQQQTVDLTQAVEQLTRDKAEFEAWVSVERPQLSALSKALNDKEANLRAQAANLEQRLSQHQVNVDASSAQLTDRETRAASYEVDIKKREDQVKVREADVLSRLRQLKALAE